MGTELLVPRAGPEFLCWGIILYVWGLYISIERKIYLSMVKWSNGQKNTTTCCTSTSRTIGWSRISSTKCWSRTSVLGDHSLCMRMVLNPFTHRVTLESIVCYSHTFGNNLGIKGNFKKYLKESCWLASDQHFSFKCFPENVFASKIIQKSSGLFWLLLVLMG